MIFFRYIIAFLACLLPCLAMGADIRKDTVNAIGVLLDDYPDARLLDIYKSAFQNRFGPGHIIANQSKAREYLDRELSLPSMHENPPYEMTIPDGSFVRVNLSVVKSGRVPYDVFFDAFVESAQTTEMPEVPDWAADWARILDVIREGWPDLPDFEADSVAIRQRLERGVYQGEHSDAFSKAYDPHYRIISRPVFEKRILPLLEPTE